MSGILHHMAWNALEASLLAAAILLVTRIRSPGASLRHALWLLVTVKLLLPPIGIPGAGLRDHLRSLTAALTARTGETVRPLDAPMPSDDDVVPALVEDDRAPLPAEAEADFDEALAVLPGAVPEAPAFVAALQPAPAALPGPPLDLESAAAALWLAGLTFILCRRARRVLLLRALLHASGEAPAAVLDECAALARRLGIRRPPRVLAAPWCSSPFLSAAGSPVIVLPICLLEPDGRGALRAVLAHELGHLKRRDHWAAWIDLLATTVFWWLPTAWIAGRAMERASDEAADACAARALGSRRTYAASLIETLEVLTWNQTPFALPGRGLGEKEAVERRLVMVLRQPLFTGLSLRSRIALVALGLFLLPAAAGPAPGQAPAIVEPVPIPEIAPVVADPPDPAEPAVPAVPVAPPAPAAPARIAPSRARPAAAEPHSDDGIAAPAAGGTGDSYGLRGRTGGQAGYALGSSDDAPRGFEERLSEVERKVDRLLREMERLTRAVAPGRSGATAGTGGRDADSPAYSPRPVAPRAAIRPGRTGAGVQAGQSAAAGPRPREERLKSIERRFEERARALRKELADLEAALEEEMRAAIERDPDDGGGDALEDGPRDPVPVPAPQPAPRVPGALNLPVTPGVPPQPVQPAQPRALPAPARN